LSKNPEKISSTTVLNIDNNMKHFRAENQHVRMISEGSCDPSMASRFSFYSFPGYELLNS